MVATTGQRPRCSWPEEGGPRGRATILVSAGVVVGRVTGRPGPCAGRFGDVGHRLGSCRSPTPWVSWLGSLG